MNLCQTVCRALTGGYAAVERFVRCAHYGSQFPAGGYAANSSFIIHHWPTAPWMLARAFAKRVKNCGENRQRWKEWRSAPLPQGQCVWK